MVIALLALPVAPANAVATAACPATIPSAGFTDLGGLSVDAVDAVNCIAYYNISKGTSATTFDPAGNVNRWQMALVPDPSGDGPWCDAARSVDQGFTDLTGLSAEATTAVNQLKQLAITTGTTATTYDPFGNVSRWQMALFITRLVNAAGISAPLGRRSGLHGPDRSECSSDHGGQPAQAADDLDRDERYDVRSVRDGRPLADGLVPGPHPAGRRSDAQGCIPSRRRRLPS